MLVTKKQAAKTGKPEDFNYVTVKHGEQENCIVFMCKGRGLNTANTGVLMRALRPSIAHMIERTKQFKSKVKDQSETKHDLFVAYTKLEGEWVILGNIQAAWLLSRKDFAKLFYQIMQELRLQLLMLEATKLKETYDNAKV